MRERKPLVHQITNYVVMNETANATLALGALPVMAHAPEEVEEMVGARGRARAQHRHALARTGSRRCSPPAGRRTRAASRSCSIRSARARPLPHRDGQADPRRGRRRRAAGNAGEVATLVGVAAEVRGVESIGAGAEPAELAAQAARALGLVASVTGPVDHVSDGERVAAVANGDPMLATITGTGCMSSAVTGCFLAVAESPFDAAVEALVAFGVAGEDAARDAKGPGSFHVNLYDALAALDPATLDARARVT